MRCLKGRVVSIEQVAERLLEVASLSTVAVPALAPFLLGRGAPFPLRAGEVYVHVADEHHGGQVEQYGVYAEETEDDQLGSLAAFEINPRLPVAGRLRLAADDGLVQRERVQQTAHGEGAGSARLVFVEA